MQNNDPSSNASSFNTVYSTTSVTSFLMVQISQTNFDRLIHFQSPSIDLQVTHAFASGMDIYTASSKPFQVIILEPPPT